MGRRPRRHGWNDPGIFLLGMVSSALNLYRVSAFWQPVATRTILGLAVGIESYSRRSVFAGP